MEGNPEPGCLVPGSPVSRFGWFDRAVVSTSMRSGAIDSWRLTAREVLYSVRAGTRELARSRTVLYSAGAAAFVAVSVALVSSVLAQVTSAGSVEVLRASTIVVLVNHESSDRSAEIRASVVSVPGVGEVRDVTMSDLAELPGGVAVGDELPQGWALALNGTETAEEVLAALAGIPGVGLAAWSVGRDAEAILQSVGPVLWWFGVALVIGAMALVFALARTVALSSVEMVETMRLLGSSRVAVLASVSLPICCVVVVASLLSLLVSAASLRIVSDTWLSEAAADSILVSRLVLVGVGATACASAAAAIGALSAVRRGSSV